MTDWGNRDRLAALAEFTVDTIVLIDGDGFIRWASPSIRDVLGWEPETLTGTRARALVAAEDLEAWRAMGAELLERPNEPFTGTFRCRHRDSSTRWMYGISRNLLNEPRIGAIVVHFRDISPAHETAAALKASDDRYRQLFEGATDIVFEADDEGYFRFVNPVTLRVFGYAEDEIIGRRFPEFIRPDHRAAVFEHYRRQADERTASTYLECPVVAKDGKDVWLGLNAWSIVDAAGRFRGMRAVARDVTERRRAEDALRQAENKYRSLVEQSIIAVYILQGERLVYVNPRGAEIAGYTVDELLALSNALDQVDEADRSYVNEQLETLAAGSVPSVHFVARVRRKDRTVVQLEAYCALTEYGGAPAILATAIDISDRVRLEDQLRQAQKMEAVGRLAGGIAHDFNNLLTAIRGNAELLHQRWQHDPVAAAETEEILHAADRAASLTRQLLAFSRKQNVAATLVDVNELVENVARMARRLIGPQVTLEIRTDAAVHAVFADPAQIEQILLNLIVNSRDAMPDGGRIRVRTANTFLRSDSVPRARIGIPEGPYVILQVIDDGVGMDQATQARIFEPFFTTKEPGRGTGLGLSTVYGILRHMGGAVDVRSSRDAGATFTVYLPAASVERSITTSPTADRGA